MILIKQRSTFKLTRSWKQNMAPIQQVKKTKINSTESTACDVKWVKNVLNITIFKSLLYNYHPDKLCPKQIQKHNARCFLFNLQTALCPSQCPLITSSQIICHLLLFHSDFFFELTFSKNELFVLWSVSGTNIHFDFIKREHIRVFIEV